MNVFLRREIAENYDDYYKTDLGKKVDRIEKEIIAVLLQDLPKKELLDLGCGTGHWTDFYRRQGFKVTGVDSSAAMLDIAKRKNMNARFLLADCEDLPFEDESFSIISSITMLEFVEHQDRAIREIYRILNKSGWLIIGCLNDDSTIGRNKAKDDVFKHAKLFKISDLGSKFHQLHLAQMKQGVYLNEQFDILDTSGNLENVAPAFVGVLFQKL